jgi:molecular chaperone DnaK (HSP70)
MGIKFVITVPAMWPEKAKAQTLCSAEKAGFGKQAEIHIISEPEAAAMHALQASNPHGLNVGDTIVLCDAGGGTVDLITFSVLQLHPSLQLQEEAPGNGSLCGSTFLNLRFEEFLQRRLSSCPGWARDTLDDALNRFEIVKRTFAGNLNDDFLFPVPGITDDERKGVTRGRLRVSGHEMAELFHPVLCDVLSLVNEQIETSTKKVKSVFLVGGFGQSPYLRNYLRQNVPRGVDVIPVVNGWTAVVRGALAKVLAETTPLVPQISVKSRLARKNYGLIMTTKFDPHVHKKTKR